MSGRFSRTGRLYLSARRKKRKAKHLIEYMKRVKEGKLNDGAGTSSQPNPSPLPDFSPMLTPITEQTSSISPTTEQTSSIAPTTEQTSSIAPTTELTSSMAPNTEQTFSIAPTTELTSSMAPNTKQTSPMSPTTEQTSAKMAPTSNQPLLQMATRKPTMMNRKFRKKHRRIVDLYFFLAELQQLNAHSQSGCNLNDIYIEHEKKVGLMSCFHCKCRVCGYLKLIWSEDPDDEKQNINSATVTGFEFIGCGFILMNELFSKMSLPILSSTLFSKESKKLAGEKNDAATVKNVDAGRNDETSDQIDDKMESFIIKDEIEIAEDETELDGTEFEFEAMPHESEYADQIVMGSNRIAVENHQTTAKIDKKVTEASRIFSEKEAIKTKKKVGFAVKETVVGDKESESEEMQYELNRIDQMVTGSETTAIDKDRVDKSVTETDRIVAENKPIKIKEEIIFPEEEDKLECMINSNEVMAESFTLKTEEDRIPTEITKIARSEIRITPMEIKTVETNRKVAKLVPETFELERNTYDFNRKVAETNQVATERDKTVTTSDRMKAGQKTEILINRESVSRVQHRDLPEQLNLAAFQDAQSEKRVFQKEMKESLEDDGDNSVNRGETSLTFRKRKWGQHLTEDT